MDKDLLMLLLPMAVIGLFVIKNRYLGSLIILLAYIVGAADYWVRKITLADGIDLFLLLRLDWGMFSMGPTVLGDSLRKFITHTAIVLIFIAIRVRYIKNRSLLCDCLNRCEYARAPFIKRAVCVLLAIMCCYVTATSNCFKRYVNIYSDYQKHLYWSAYSAEDILKKLGVQEHDYFKKRSVHAGKNIIIIYCESLENGFQDRELHPDLMPKLCELKRSDKLIAYDNYNMLGGASWTIGALYATNTGLPCYFGRNGDSVFNKGGFGSDGQVVNRVLSLGKIFKQAGYRNIFLSSAKLDFGGTGNLMNNLGYSVKNYDAFDVDCQRTDWGVHDGDLFKQAKKDFLKIYNGEAPFNITLLTIDTHFTHGVPDERLRDIVPAHISTNDLEYSVYSLDYLLYDFYCFIKDNDYKGNTEIVIMGDHLLMGDETNTPATKILNKKTRKVSLLSSSKSKAYGTHDAIYYYDIPYFILDIAGIKNDYKFPKEFLDMSPEKVNNSMELFEQLNNKLFE